MTGLSSTESFLKSQESLVQGAIRTPKPINILKTEFDTLLNKYNATENAKISRNDDEDYDIYIGPSSSENSSKTNSCLTLNSSISNSSVNIPLTKDSAESNNSAALDKNSQESIGSTENIMKSQQKLVIPNTPTPIFNRLTPTNLKKDTYFSREDVFKKNLNNDDDEVSMDSKKDYLDEEEKKLNERKKKTKLKQFLKLHKENFLLEMPNALYSDIISESIKILTKTSQNYTSQLGKKDESTIGSIKHLEHLKAMIPSGNKYQQHIDNNSNSSQFGPGYLQLCAPIDENGQYVQLKEKVLINSLESLNSTNSIKLVNSKNSLKQ